MKRPHVCDELESVKSWRPPPFKKIILPRPSERPTKTMSGRRPSSHFGRGTSAVDLHLDAAARLHSFGLRSRLRGSWVRRAGCGRRGLGRQAHSKRALLALGRLPHELPGVVCTRVRLAHTGQLNPSQPNGTQPNATQFNPSAQIPSELNRSKPISAELNQRPSSNL